MRAGTVKSHLRCAALALCLVGLAPARATAWGGKGHRVIATLAESLLTETARRQINDLFGRPTSIVSVAMWADEVGRARGTSEWHFVEIPLNSVGYNPAKDCPRGTCLIEAIERQREILAGHPRYNYQQRAEALRYLVHLVGDVHQPFHCADNNDRGGNNVRVTFFGRETNLHRVWDTDMIERVSFSEKTYAARLREQLGNRRASLERGNAQAWALESRDAARRAYNLPSSKTLGSDYYNPNRAVMDEQLLKAGVRLARVLNESLR